MGPIQKAVTRAVNDGLGDFWSNYLENFDADSHAIPLSRAMTRNVVAHNASLHDQIRMEMCTEFGRTWQEG